MKERPILMNGPMVSALLAGTKTQTRRLMTPQPVGVAGKVWPDEDRWEWPCAAAQSMLDMRDVVSGCPHGTRRDRLWVRETWQYAGWTEDGLPWIRYSSDGSERLCERIPDEWADRLTDTWAELSAAENMAIDGRAADRKWRPSIFLPRWASRIALEVTEVRVQRLQDISGSDAKAEGAPILDDDPLHGAGNMAALSWFRSLWDDINCERAPWENNPWVWAISFRALGADETGGRS